LENDLKKMLISFVLIISFNLNANAMDDINVGLLPESRCYDDQAEVQNQPNATEANQRYWYLRTPPYVGYSKGEQTHAGDVTQCVVGYPKYNQKTVVIMLNKKMIEIYPAKISSVKSQVFYSKNNKFIVEILETGKESTCAPDGESCCGQYTYATAIIRYAVKTKRLNVVKYEGG
jgi:hypothetical protein